MQPIPIQEFGGIVMDRLAALSNCVEVAIDVRALDKR